VVWCVVYCYRKRLEITVRIWYCEIGNVRNISAHILPILEFAGALPKYRVFFVPVESFRKLDILTSFSAKFCKFITLVYRAFAIKESETEILLPDRRNDI